MNLLSTGSKESISVKAKFNSLDNPIRIASRAILLVS